MTLEQFVDDLIEFGLDAPKPFGEMFWGMHDAAYMLRRWSAFVPAERMHVVTVASRAAPRDTLWKRFCAATGLDPAAYDAEIERANPSMGVAETELVRRMNFEVQGDGAGDLRPAGPRVRWPRTSSAAATAAAAADGADGLGHAAVAAADRRAHAPRAIPSTATSRT